MNTLSYQQFERLLSQLPLGVKWQMFYKIANELGTSLPGVEKTQGVCGGSACIIRTRIPVWTLVAFQQVGLTDTQLLIAYPTLRLQDLNNAWAYYAHHKAEIDLEIRENNL